jgi:hypothetical protein
MKVYAIIFLMLMLPLCSSAHYIVGYVGDSLDEEQSANGRIVYLWKSDIMNNLTDIVGPLGNSKTDNIYMIDCEPLFCEVGDNLSLGIFDEGFGYITEIVNVTVTGFGFSQAGNLTLNSPPKLLSTEITDMNKNLLTEINLIATTTKNVYCRALVEDSDGEDTLVNASAIFYNTEASSLFSSDNNNLHYTNSSCYINRSYGSSKQAEILCNFSLWYYANYGNWLCNISISDNLTNTDHNFTQSIINQLISIGVMDVIPFEYLNEHFISEEVSVGVTNYGNTKINISLSGFAESEEDNYSMVCFNGYLPIDYQKFNLSYSNSQEVDDSEFNRLYENLSSSPVIYELNLDYRTNPILNDATKQTYWRVKMVPGLNGPCRGNIVFGAIEANA